MKKQILMLMLGIILLPALAMAADFSGSWVLDKANSDPAPNTMYWLTRGGNTMGGGGRNAPVILTVHQDGMKMHVVDAQSMVRDYMLDGKPHTRATDTAMEKAVVTADVQGDNLEINTTEPYGGMPGNATLTVKELWSLSPDGKTLTITTTRDVAARQQTYKQVYNRSQTEPGAICSAGCVVLH